MKRVITFGTFDVLHIGHIRILQRARALGDHLTVGISTDAMNFSKKQKKPVYSQFDRMEIVKAIAGVDEVFLEHSLDLKGEYIKKYKSDILVMGNDWEGRFDEFKALCEVVYLPRTEGISTTELLAEIRASASGLA
ncbi:adenylyltransferase/cytidyltransferase family protein [Rhizobium sp. ARZ01]|uniref:adenylyltransferase/cytidyltransferase family protein n=1 Tax=Rhizobium sp. ARZ01 TaxID=2769313 RepID=UPI00177B9B81|nr:adenylyltransferase/cytidyltransferase family protein [Rhizobium sp. ARZ01]MBD9373210.1 adenylyltransferase/cytidyltransferase family protein [Rhizobium sp. ARZ01]